MQRTACHRLFFLLIAFLLSGCGTITALSTQDYAVYGGVVRDFSAIQAGGLGGMLAIIDLPLSFALDTLLLPLTLSK